MRLVIDMQVGQTSSQYSVSGCRSVRLVKEMAKLNSFHEILLVLNSAFGDSIDFLRDEFEGFIPQSNIFVWTGVKREGWGDDDGYRKVSGAMYEAFIADLNPDVVWIPSLFEEEDKGAVTSIGAFTKKFPTAVTVDDFVWKKQQSFDSSTHSTQKIHFLKIEHLRRADLLFFASNRAKREAHLYLNIPLESQAVICNAAEDVYVHKTVTDAEYSHLSQTYGIGEKFVVCPIDLNFKEFFTNFLSAVRRLPDSFRKTYQFVLAFTHSLGEQEGYILNCIDELGLDRSIFCILELPSVADKSLLYNASSLILYSSFCEYAINFLEVLSCGSLVITESNLDLSPVIVDQDSTFISHDTDSLANKIIEVLQNEELQSTLKQNGINQAKKFNLNQNARYVLEELEKLHVSYSHLHSTPVLPKKRLSLAFVSPLPPQKTGIADYSAELLPELHRHYNITVISDQEKETCLWSCPDIRLRSVSWFRRHSGQFDRVIYQVGNSSFHAQMIDLLLQIPGVVVLHDFFLSDLMWHLEAHGRSPEWTNALVAEDGWGAVVSRMKAQGGTEVESIVRKYPCNINVLQRAEGVIVHSEFCRQLAQQFYGPSTGEDWALIPLVRGINILSDKNKKQELCGVSEDVFFVCSFGALGKTKLNHRLLEAWLDSSMAKDPRFYLVFVGENHNDDYGRDLLQTIKSSEFGDRVIITGWADEEVYHSWLLKADVAVQLRTTSRGETSKAVLDCMSYGVPTIVNANGPMAELQRDSVLMLEDNFNNKDLSFALNYLVNLQDQREKLGREGRACIINFHNPRYCADLYRDAIERFANKVENTSPGVIDYISSYDSGFNFIEFSRAMANNIRPSYRLPRIFIDISAQIKTHLHSGIERVTCSILRKFLADRREKYIVEPVYATADKEGYYYARKFTSRFLDIPDGWAEDAPIDACSGDVFLSLDFEPNIMMNQHKWLMSLRRQGVLVYSVVHDLLPVTMPEVFPQSGLSGEIHQRWLQMITKFDGALCVSRTVADELFDWLDQFGEPRRRPFALQWFHHGADFTTANTDGTAWVEGRQIIDKIKSRVTFLMVGSIEPRKGYLQTLQAFDLLWKQGVDVNLVIVGKEGWKELENNNRRDIPETVEMLCSHPEKGNRLIWLDKCSDFALEQIYGSCNCLLSASYGEGFGLPLIEAAHHGLPLLVRDLSVFREVTGGHATFFQDDRSPNILMKAVIDWLQVYKSHGYKEFQRVPVQSWEHSKNQILEAILNRIPPYRLWKK